MNSQQKFKKLVSTYARPAEADDASAPPSFDSAASIIAPSWDASQRSSQKRRRASVEALTDASDTQATDAGGDAPARAAPHPSRWAADSTRGRGVGGGVGGAAGGITCAKCARVDLEALLSTDPAVPAAGFATVCLLDHVVAGTACGRCKFFLEMRPTEGLKTLAGHGLIATVASRAFGIQFRGFVDVLLFAVCRTGERGSQPKKLAMRLGPDEPNSVSVRKVTPMIDWDVVKEWLRFCQTHHTTVCSRRHLSPLPGLRVIDCDTRKITKIRDPSIEYVTLSYVWGVDEAAPEEDFKIPPDLPATIEDAIQAVNHLGYKYLWIDRYCVPQRDSDEKNRLIQNMGDVYENSVLTLIAAAGSTPHHGLPGVSALPRTPQSQTTISTHTLLSALTCTTDEITASKWNSRGWTYQEALLSRRKLVFTASQLYFQCAGMHVQESLRVPLRALHTNSAREFRFDVGLPKAFPARGLGRSPWDVWDRISEYLRREFTHDADVLLAFQGILAAFARDGRKVPPAGFHGVVVLPASAFAPGRRVTDAERLLFGLGWFVRGACVRRGGAGRLPSWTWAGWRFRADDPGARLDPPCAFKRGRASAPFVGCARVVAGYDEAGERLLCGDDGALDEMLRRSKVEPVPPVLRVRGRVCDVRARVRGGQLQLTVGGSETPLVVQGDLQGRPSRNTAMKGVVLGFDVGENHVHHWILLVMGNPGKIERVGVAIFTKDVVSNSSIDHAVDLPFKSTEEEIILS